MLLAPERSLVSKVALAILVVGTGMALSFALASLILVREHEIRGQIDETRRLLETVESTVRIACFTSDAVLAGDVAEGLLTHPAVAGVLVSSGTQPLVARWRGQQPAGVEEGRKVRRIVHSPFDPRVEVGEIVLVVDPQVIARRAERDSLLIALLLLLQVLAVTVGVAYVVDRTVVAPIRRFARSLAAGGGAPRRRLPVPRGHESNEIGQLVAVFNRQMASLSSALDHEQAMRQQIAESERRFRTLAENSPDIILRHDLQQRLVFANPAFASETGLRLDQVLDRRIEQAGTWRASLPYARYKAVLRRVLRTRQPVRLQWDWVGPAGRAVFHEMNVVPEFDSEGRPVGTLAIGRNVTSRQDAERRLLHLATHDTLTGLPNRALLKDRLQEAIQVCAREDRSLAMLFIDLDHFKNVNDTLGHETGDELLKVLAERMRSVLRAGDTIARLGGDEFVVLLQECADPPRLEAALTRLFDVVAAPCDVGEHRLYAGASIGIALFPQDGADIETLMRNADTAMYAAKAQGRNTYRFFSAQMNEAVRETLQMSGDLRRALANREFELHYQPKYEVAGGRLTGMEALIRWRHPQRGRVPPARFIAIAEQCGLITAIDAWVLDEACRQMRAWMDAGLPPARVAVNLSALQCEEGNLLQDVQAALARHRLPGGLLELEITESAVMSNADATIRAFSALRDIGVRLAVDDFGTGYSSLSYLKRLPVHNVKIDRAFVNDIETEANSREIIRAIIAMAHSLRLKVIAEGVETAGQLEDLRAAGCDEFQGYLASHPLGACDMEGLLRALDRLELAPPGDGGLPLACT